MCSIDQKKQKGREGGKLEKKKKERKKKIDGKGEKKKKKIKTVYIFFNLINENVILPIHMN